MWESCVQPKDVQSRGAAFHAGLREVDERDCVPLLRPVGADEQEIFHFPCRAIGGTRPLPLPLDQRAENPSKEDYGEAFGSKLQEENTPWLPGHERPELLDLGLVRLLGLDAQFLES